MDETQHVIPIADSGRIHLTRCESCMYGSCFDEITWHSWAGAEDIEHALATGQDVEAIKRQRCACACAGPMDQQKDGR